MGGSRAWLQAHHESLQAFAVNQEGRGQQQPEQEGEE